MSQAEVDKRNWELCVAKGQVDTVKAEADTATLASSPHAELYSADDGAETAKTEGDTITLTNSPSACANAPVGSTGTGGGSKLIRILTKLHPHP